MLEFNPQLAHRRRVPQRQRVDPVTRSNGVTTTAVTPGSSVLSGQVAIIDLEQHDWEESAMQRWAGIAFPVPELGSNRRMPELKNTGAEKLAGLSTLLNQARAYAKGGPNKEIDWVLDAMVPIVNKGSAAAHRRADREADIRPRSNSPIANTCR